MLCHAGKRPAVRQLQAAAALTVVAMLAITGMRAEEGRKAFTTSTGLGARVEALSGGLTGLSAPGQPPLLAQLTSRLDDDSFTAAILQAQSLGQPRLSPASVPESLLLAVPSVAWSSKLGHALNPALMQSDDFGLQQVNFLPGLPGMYAGFLSPWQMAVLLGVLGAACGRGERSLLRSRSPARLVMLGGAVITVFLYQGGLPAMLVSLRSTVAVAFLAWLAARLGQTTAGSTLTRT